MDVHYPLQSEIQNEIEDIILKGMPQKISFLKRMKKIYLGPGLRVIYYKKSFCIFCDVHNLFCCVSWISTFLWGGNQTIWGSFFRNARFLSVVFLFYLLYGRTDADQWIKKYDVLFDELYCEPSSIFIQQLYYLWWIPAFYSLVGLGRKQSYRLELLEFQVCWSLRSLLYTFYQQME